MKTLVYLVMFLLLDPVLRLGGVVVAGLYLLVLVGVGIALLVGRKDRRGNGSQQQYRGHWPAGYADRGNGYGAPVPPGYARSYWDYGPPVHYPPGRIGAGAPWPQAAAASAPVPWAAPAPAVVAAPAAPAASVPGEVDAVAALWLDDPTAPPWIRNP